MREFRNYRETLCFFMPCAKTSLNRYCTLRRKSLTMLNEKFLECFTKYRVAADGIPTPHVVLAPSVLSRKELINLFMS